MAEKFQFNFIELTKDKDPSISKTVKRVVVNIREMFFEDESESVRKAIVDTLFTILENCFINRMYEGNKKAKDLIF
jgi:hypothetical protein